MLPTLFIVVTILNNIVEPESGVTMRNNIVERTYNMEQYVGSTTLFNPVYNNPEQVDHFLPCRLAICIVEIFLANLCLS